MTNRSWVDDPEIVRRRQDLARECDELVGRVWFQLKRKYQAPRFFTDTDAKILDRVATEIWLRRLKIYFLGGPPVYGKANFNPDQPRVPAGNPNGGQWTNTGGDVGSRTSSITGEPRLRITIYAHQRNESEQSPGPAPNIPVEEPATEQLRNIVIKEAARWLLRAALYEAANPAVGTFFNLLEAAEWTYRYYPYLQSYLDPPKSLVDLQHAVAQRKCGYEVHHIVEKGPAARKGYPRAIIEGRDNLVRIPALKHRLITGWYMTPNKLFDWKSPRAYLEDKDWAERRRVGLQALIIYRVLTP